MGRQLKDSRIETREARLKLKQKHEPYWRELQSNWFPFFWGHIIATNHQPDRLRSCSL